MFHLCWNTIPQNNNKNNKPSTKRTARKYAHNPYTGEKSRYVKTLVQFQCMVTLWTGKHSLKQNICVFGFTQFARTFRYSRGCTLFPFMGIERASMERQCILYVEFTISYWIFNWEARVGKSDTKMGKIRTQIKCKTEIESKKKVAAAAANAVEMAEPMFSCNGDDLWIDDGWQLRKLVLNLQTMYHWKKNPIVSLWLRNSVPRNRQTFFMQLINF